MIYSTFKRAREELSKRFQHQAQDVKAPRWQGVDVSQKPEMAMKELLHVGFQVPLDYTEDVKHWASDTACNLPWADIHFQERVSGEPLNPGESWKSWPWSNSADKFRYRNGQYDHTYMERIWPKYAGYTPEGKLSYEEVKGSRVDKVPPIRNDPLAGIRFEYGDLNDLVDHLLLDPLSRQAYLPIWFPEDGTCRGRRPCTLGYHFILRNDYFHHTYFIRSCDFVRHWADDCYLAIRLHLWILDRLRERDSRWSKVLPGMFTMHIVSLHMFVNDFNTLYGQKKTASPIPPT